MAGALLHLNSTTVLASLQENQPRVHLPEKTANRRVLVLGGTGRVGGSTAIALSKLCPDLRIIVGGRNREKGAAMLAKLGENSEFAEVNIDNVKSLEAALNEELVAAIGCKVGSLPTSYLGLPLEGVLMGGGALERKIHLVRWELGKYGEEQGGWSSKEARGEGHGVGLWKTLRKEWEVVKRSNSQRVDDRVIWRETNCGKFSVKSLYKSLVSGHPISFPSSAIWKVSMQPRVSFFGWEATWGKALTLDQLQRRGWALANRCYLCQRHEESIDHILLHCDKVRTLWVLLYSMFGVQWVLPATVKETLSGWNGSFVGKKRKGVWKASPLCLFGRFGRQGTKLLLRKRSCQSKDSSFFCLFSLVRDEEVYKRWSLDLS
ncbi:hypothetical protein CK203_080171 [Vitis vinifera]|uniref:Saccharopine dehydrogenase NADP binding domain-containing protein n=1 Tax=Vitis vinifera TaxID=29760 RepID=A0A438F2N2_VITVI|nr:hypothetical protein CK203_080171 [Vitis vinifera]